MRTSCWGEKYDHFPLKLSAAAAHFEAIRLSLLSLHTNKDPFSAWVLFSREVETGIQGGAGDAQAPLLPFATLTIASIIFKFSAKIETIIRIESLLSNQGALKKKNYR